MARYLSGIDTKLHGHIPFPQKIPSTQSYTFPLQMIMHLSNNVRVFSLKNIIYEFYEFFFPIRFALKLV